MPVVLSQSGFWNQYTAILQPLPIDIEVFLYGGAACFVGAYVKNEFHIKCEARKIALSYCLIQTS